MQKKSTTILTLQDLIQERQLSVIGERMGTTVDTELKVTPQSALDMHMGCTPFVKDW